MTSTSRRDFLGALALSGATLGASRAFANPVHRAGSALSASFTQ